MALIKSLFSKPSQKELMRKLVKRAMLKSMIISGATGEGADFYYISKGKYITHKAGEKIRERVLKYRFN